MKASDATAWWFSAERQFRGSSQDQMPAYFFDHFTFRPERVRLGLLHEGGPTQQNTTRNTTINRYSLLQPAAASKAQSKTYDRQTCFQQKSWPLAGSPQTCRTSHRGQPNKKTPTASLSKRERTCMGWYSTPRTSGARGHSTSQVAKP
jgi:hypothetical protein